MPLPGEVQHFRGAGGTTAVRQYNLRFRVLQMRRQLAFRRDAFIIKNAWEIQPLMQMIGALSESAQDYRALRLRGLLLNLAATLLAQSSSRKQSGRMLRPSQCHRLTQFAALHAGAGERLAPSDLAEEVQLSGDYFARVFRTTYGMPPRAWLKTERMRQAAIRLRESTLSIKQRSRWNLDSGEQVLFFRQFREVIGCICQENFRRRG